MDKDNLTPAQRMDDEEYKNLIINKFGHIKGLAKTMLILRKSMNSDRQDTNEIIAKKRASKQDIAVFGQIIKDVDAARKLLNKLHMQLIYSQNERALPELSFFEIQETINLVKEHLNKTENMCLKPLAEREAEEIMTDYLDY